MKKTDRWMPLYVADYLADTSRLSTEQHGAYMLILMDYWRKGPPPDSDEVLAAIARLPLSQWRKHCAVVAPFFQIEDGVWKNKRLDTEKERADAVSSKRRDSGKAGATAKWKQEDGKSDGKTMANAMANAEQSGCQNDRQSQSQEAIPFPNGNGAEPDSPDPVKTLFDTGVLILTAAGQPPTTARSLVAKLRQTVGDAEAFAVLASARDKTDPSGWIGGAIAQREKAKRIDKNGQFRAVT